MIMLDPPEKAISDKGMQPSAMVRAVGVIMGCLLYASARDFCAVEDIGHDLIGGSRADLSFGG